MESNKSRTSIFTSPGSSDKNIRFYNLSTEEQYLSDLTIDMPFVHRHFYDDHNFSKENGWKGFIEKIKIIIQMFMKV